MGEPSHRPARRSALRLLVLAAVVAVLGFAALNQAPEAARLLAPGVGALVARAWSVAAPEPAAAGAATKRLEAAEARALAAEAEEAWQRGDWATVAANLTALAAAGPRTREQDDRLYEAELNLGWALLAEGRPQEAEARLAVALQIKPDGPEALEGLRMARQPAAAWTGQAATTGEAVHIVQPGDTLFALARRFGTTVEAIKAANGLPCNTILAGQKLVIPACAPACPTPAARPVVLVPVCPTPTPVCVPVVVPVVVCVPVCPPVVCVPVCPTPVCIPICPTPVCVPVDP